MTRNDFLITINDWDSLISFCYSEDCPICENIYSEYEMDNYINEHLVDMAKDARNWYSFRDNLASIPTDNDYYLCNGFFDWHELTDDDFIDYKSDVMNWMDDGEYWEEYEEDEEEFIDEDWFEDEPIPSDIDTQELENLIVD